MICDLYLGLINFRKERKEITTMLTKSTLQKIKTAYVGKKGKGRIVFDPEGVERFNIAHLILTDVQYRRSVIITISTLAGKLEVYSFKGEITIYEINDIQSILDNN
jgi:hypothetical protein